MRITLEANYAIRIIDCLANTKSRLSAKIISERTGVSLRFALKILRKLCIAKLIRSYKGAQGGYELIRKPGDINLKDVIETVDGPIAINRCEENCICSKVESVELCAYFAIFTEMSEMIRDKLASINFDRKAPPIITKQPKS